MMLKQIKLMVKKYYTFQPNTIVYAVDVDSDLNQIKKTKLELQDHTTYEVATLPDMKQSLMQM